MWRRCWADEFRTRLRALFSSGSRLRLSHSDGVSGIKLHLPLLTNEAKCGGEEQAHHAVVSSISNVFSWADFSL